MNPVETISREPDTARQASISSGSSGNRVSRLLIAFTLLLLGICALCRFYNLDSKLIWNDEEGTFVYICSTPEEIAMSSLAGKPMSTREWRQVERIASTAPSAEILQNLKTRKIPDQAPLFYLLLRRYVQMFGSSPGTVRTLCVALSLAAMPLVFVLAMQMFGSLQTAWLSMALVACSPLFMIYSQEARPYSLWLCVTLLSWVLLCRAQKRMSQGSWLLYSVSSAVGTLTHYAAVCVHVASTVALLLAKRRPLIKWAALASTTTLLLVIPWFAHVGPGFNHVEAAYLTRSIGVGEYLLDCSRNLASVFFDADKHSNRLGNIIVGSLVILLELISLAYACSRATREGRVVLNAAALYLVLFALLDVTFGGCRLTVVRYLLPSLAVLPICTAAYLDSLLRSRFRIGAAGLSFVVVVGLTACVQIAQSRAWHNKEFCGHNPLQVATLLNSKPHPLWIGTSFYEVLLMSRLVNEHVLLEFATPNHVTIPDRDLEIFFCDHNQLLPAVLKDGKRIAKPNPSGQELWQLFLTKSN